MALVSFVVEIPDDVWRQIEVAAASPQWACAPEQLASLWLTRHIRSKQGAERARAAASDEWASMAHHVAPDPETWDTAERLHPYSQRLATQALERAMTQMKMVHGVLAGEIRPFEERPDGDETLADRGQGEEG